MDIQTNSNEKVLNLDFNPDKSFVMHLDINSCFATIEQQANPFLRGKPLIVAAYDSPGGCIISPSIEAKEKGIKVGMKIKDAKEILPDIFVLSPDPWKYRNVYLSLRKILLNYTDNLVPKSIDEFVLNLKGYPCLRCKNTFDIANEIKKRIKKEIGEWISVSVGVSTNRFLAKLASSLHKPNGFDEINKDNFLKIYSKLVLTDLSGIKFRNSLKLNMAGVFNVLDFYKSPLSKLKTAFKSINGYYWYLRLRGWEIDDFKSSRKSFGNSFVFPKPIASFDEMSPILSKLVEKMAFRLRKSGYKTQGVCLGLSYEDKTFWRVANKTSIALFDSRDIYKEISRSLNSSCFKKPARGIFVSCFNLTKEKSFQLEFFNDVLSKQKLTESLDKINISWGDFTIYPGRMVDTEKYVPDRIAFGGVKEIEEFILK